MASGSEGKRGRGKELKGRSGAKTRRKSSKKKNYGFSKLYPDIPF